MFGAFIPLFSTFGAFRLARPSSRWATRFYEDDKIRRAESRAAQFDARYQPVLRRASNFFAGAPETGEGKD